MVIADILDYAPHVIEIKKLTIQVHDLLNEGHYVDAKELALRLQAESKLLNTAIASRLNGS